MATTAHVNVAPVTQKAQTAVAAVGDSIESPSTKNLSYLGFVAGAAATATATADSVYKQARPLTPAAAEPYVAKVEDTVAAYTAPVVATAQDVGEKLLARADEQIHYVAKTTTSVVNKGKENLAAVVDAGKVQLSNGTSTLKELHTAGVQQFSAATHKYLDFLHDLSNWLVDTLSPSKNITRAKEQLHAAIALAKEASDPDVAVVKVQDAWNSFAAIPAVSKLLSTAEPVTKFGQSSFFKAHDTLVGSPYYKKVFNLSTGTLAWATTTTPYKLSSTYLYPWVKPVADPALEKINNSKSISTAFNYWKPIATA